MVSTVMLHDEPGSIFAGEIRCATFCLDSLIELYISEPRLARADKSRSQDMVVMNRRPTKLLILPTSLK